MSKQKRTWDVILVVVMVLLCLLWIYPIVLILLNSLKTEGSFTTSTVFRLPTAETFAGLRIYVYIAICIYIYPVEWYISAYHVHEHGHERI